MRKKLEMGRVCHLISGELLSVCRLLVKRVSAYVVLVKLKHGFGNRNFKTEALAAKTSKTESRAAETFENGAFGGRNFENGGFGCRNLENGASGGRNLGNVESGSGVVECGGVGLCVLLRVPK